MCLLRKCSYTYSSKYLLLLKLFTGKPKLLIPLQTCFIDEVHRLQPASSGHSVQCFWNRLYHTSIQFLIQSWLCCWLIHLIERRIWRLEKLVRWSQPFCALVLWCFFKGDGDQNGTQKSKCGVPIIAALWHVLFFCVFSNKISFIS